MVERTVAMVAEGERSSVEEAVPKTWTKVAVEVAVKVLPERIQSESATAAVSTVKRPATLTRPGPVRSVNDSLFRFNEPPCKKPEAERLVEETLPAPDTRNTVEELIWKSMKLPLNGVRLAAMKVPEAEPPAPVRRLGPR